jgi:dUTP pyrophosphatase
MKFEKIQEKTYRAFLTKGPSMESAQQLEDKVKFFNDVLALPKRNTAYSAGYDFVCPVDAFMEPGQKVLIPTGIKVQLDQDKVLTVYPRSSLGTKQDCMMANTTGIIDSDYYNNEDNEGHILIMIKNNSKDNVIIKQGDRLCQGIISQFFVAENDEIGVGEVRKGGLGSTGK